MIRVSEDELRLAELNGIIDACRDQLRWFKKDPTGITQAEIDAVELHAANARAEKAQVEARLAIAA